MISGGNLKQFDFKRCFYYKKISFVNQKRTLPKNLTSMCTAYAASNVTVLLNQYSPVPRARSSIAGKDARAARAQIYASLGSDRRVVLVQICYNVIVCLTGMKIVVLK